MSPRVAIGDSLGTLERTPTRVGLFLYGVAHWTAHRIHYDPDWARHEGYPEVLVTAQLMSAWQIELLTQWAGSQEALIRLSERNVAPAFAGDTLTVSAEVTGVSREVDHTIVECAVRVRAGERSIVESVAVLRLTEIRGAAPATMQ
jgi:hydroxyacyl-ACP dehydratase HTD2-like protein with hotdog domain